MVFLRFYLWIAPNILLAVCLVGMLRRNLYRRYPLLFSYLAAEVAQFIVSGAIVVLIQYSLSTMAIYRWALVLGSAATTTLALGLLFELTNELILSHSVLVTPARRVARWSAGILVLIAVGCSALFRQGGIEQQVATFQTVDFSGNVICAGLLLTLFLFTRALRISWRSLPAGIALGFGVSASAELSASILLSVFGRSGYVDIDLLRMTASHIRALIWIAYICFEETPPRFSGTGLRKVDAEFWDQELQRMVQR